MTRVHSWQAGLNKEVRGLLPLWAACIAALGAALFRSESLVREAAGIAYIIGPLAIGAHAVGQEYTYHTLPMLLAQPVERRRTFVLKLGVAGVMIATVALLASSALADEAAHTPGWRLTSVQALPILGGLLVAPWLTMVCRSSVAGILLTGSIAALTHITAIAVVAWRLGLGAGASQARILGPWAIGMILFSLVAGALGVRRFIHLEAFDGAPPSIQLPRWLARGASVRTHRPMRALIAKELHLQQLTFVLAGFFFVGSLAVSWLQRAIPQWSDAPIGAIMLLYCMCLALVIGTLASAEERQLGTLEWQMLQPAPAWQQWLVKIGVALGLALLLAGGLPALLSWLSPDPGMRITLHLVVPVILLTAWSLYVSSLSTSGVRAVVLSLPAGVATVLVVQSVERMLGALTTRVPFDTAAFGLAMYGVALTAVPLLLAFGFVNHRSPDRPFRRVAWQVAVLATAVAIGMGGAALGWAPS